MAGNHNMVTNAGLRLTIRAGTGDGTGIVQAKALLIDRRCHGPGPGNGAFQIIGHLVHTGNYYYRVRTVNNSCDTVAGAVNIHHLSVHAESIGTGDKHIGRKTGFCDLIPLFGTFAFIPVKGLVVTCIQRYLCPADRVDGRASSFVPQYTASKWRFFKFFTKSSPRLL